METKETKTYADRIQQCGANMRNTAEELFEIRSELREKIEAIMLSHTDDEGRNMLLSLDNSVLVSITNGDRWDETYCEIPEIEEDAYVDEIVFNDEEGETMFGITAYTNGEIENCTYNLYQLDAYSLNEIYEALCKQLNLND